ncbi:MAG TPA: 2-amino-4-hydroxy-6-hydroxymethyldihydropteridine diphosphokinase, partial [Polyangiales bacterium]|nr:2-amino-4-hydroxy-6-hydroxymethyldihydropteridine diphosphokinase [Polyangiales bacterium]
MQWAVLGLGTNLGARRAILEGAIALLGDRVLARSALYTTPPLGPPQPDYLNAAVRVRWDEPLEALLVRVQELEASFDRQRTVRWGPRTLDVDILYASSGPLQTPSLQVPHPDLEQRTFALAPLLDVAPERAALAARLLELGGRPARAPWSTIVREGGSLCGEWLHDPDELVAQYFTLGGLGRGASLVRPFVVAGEPLNGDVLAGIVRDADAAGFVPRTGAVLRR